MAPDIEHEKVVRKEFSERGGDAVLRAPVGGHEIFVVLGDTDMARPPCALCRAMQDAVCPPMRRGKARERAERAPEITLTRRPEPGIVAVSDIDLRLVYGAPELHLGTERCRDLLREAAEGAH